MAAAAGPASGRCGLRLRGGLLAAHLVEIPGVDTARCSGLVHPHKGHGGTGGGVGGGSLHGGGLCAHQMRGGAGGVHKGRTALQLLDHLLVLFAGLDTGNAQRDDLDAAQPAPLGAQLLIQGLGQLGGVAGQGGVADALLADPGKGGLQGGHQLGLELAVQRVAGVGVFHIAADIGVKQDGVDHPVAVLAEAPDADVDIDAGALVHHPEGHRVGGAVLVAGELPGIDIVDALVGTGLPAKAEPLAQLGKHAVDVLQPAAEQGGLGAGVVGVLAGFGTEVHHLALLHDQHALAVGHGDHRAVRDDVFAAVPVGGAAVGPLLALDGQHLRRQSVTIKIFLPLVAHHAGCRAHGCFDETHNFNLLLCRAVPQSGEWLPRALRNLGQV